MDKSKKIILIILAIVVAIVWSAKYCSNKVGDIFHSWISPSMNYENAFYFTPASEGSLDTLVDNISVTWINGSVTIQYAQQDSITWKETYTCNPTDTSNMLHYWLDNNTLYINYCASNNSNNKDIKKGWDIRLSRPNQSIRNICKDLTITLPQDWMLDNLEIHNVNGFINTEVNAKEIELGNVNGEKTIHTALSSKIKMESVNGSSWIYLPDSTTWQAKFDKVNGSFSSDFPAQKEGDTYTSGQAPWVEIEVKSVNGSLGIKKM